MMGIMAEMALRGIRFGLRSGGKMRPPRMGLVPGWG